MDGNNYDITSDLISRLESVEKDECNLPMIFVEMFKDEVNANSEVDMYNGIKGIIKKYSNETSMLAIVNEFTSILTGGASLEEIIQIAMDEAQHPTLAQITAETRVCRTDD